MPLAPSSQAAFHAENIITKIFAPYFRKIETELDQAVLVLSKIKEIDPKGLTDDKRRLFQLAILDLKKILAAYPENMNLTGTNQRTLEDVLQEIDKMIEYISNGIDAQHPILIFSSDKVSIGKRILFTLALIDEMFQEKILEREKIQEKELAQFTDWIKDLVQYELSNKSSCLISSNFLLIQNSVFFEKHELIHCKKRIICMNSILDIALEKNKKQGSDPTAYWFTYRLCIMLENILKAKKFEIGVNQNYDLFIAERLFHLAIAKIQIHCEYRRAQQMSIDAIYLMQILNEAMTFARITDAWVTRIFEQASKHFNSNSLKQLVFFMEKTLAQLQVYQLENAASESPAIQWQTQLRIAQTQLSTLKDKFQRYLSPKALTNHGNAGYQPVYVAGKLMSGSVAGTPKSNHVPPSNTDLAHNACKRASRRGLPIS